MKQTILLAVILILTLFTPIHAQPPKPGQSLDIKPSADGKSFTITPRATQDAAWGLIELVNPKTGNVERVLYAGRISRETSIAFTPDVSIKPGEYLLRLRDGITLAFDRPVLRPDSPTGQWVNPTHLAWHNGFLFIGEAGFNTPEIVAQRSPELTWATRDGKTVKGICARVEEGNALIIASDPALGVVPVDPDKQAPDVTVVVRDVQKQTADWRALIKFQRPFIIKLGPDGKPASNWGDHGYCRDAPIYPGTMHGLTADENGSLYMPYNDASTVVIGPLGLLEKRNVGDFTGNAPRSVAAAGPKKLYVVPYTGYLKLFVCDRTLDGAAANLYTVSPFKNGSWITNCIAADASGNVYMADPHGTLTKYTDTGKTVEENYVSTPDPVPQQLGGISLSKNLVWLAAHGPGPGPFWDSGGGGEVLLFYDSGKSLSLLARFGTPGLNTDPIEFLNPRATLMTPDHKQLYVAEDGLPNTDGPPGNARVSLFKIKAAFEDATPIQIPK